MVSLSIAAAGTSLSERKPFMDATQSTRDTAADLPVPPNLAGQLLVPATTPGGAAAGTGIGHRSGDGEFSEKTEEVRAKFAEETHQYIREYIRLADQKAAFYFAGTTALLAFLFRANLLHHWLKPPLQWALTDILSFVASVGLVVSALACILVVKPNTQGSKRGIIFFRAIREFQSGTEYASEVLAKDMRGLTTAKLCHAFDLSQVCDRKYNLLNVGVTAGAIGVISAIGMLFLSPQ